MRLKIALASATAMGLLIGAAYANNNNTLYLEQEGDGNTASVHQSSGGGNNDIGTVGDPVTQDGNNNLFQFSNSPSGSGANNDIIKAEQEGDGNSLKITTWNVANNNVVNNFQQLGNNNTAAIGMNGSDDGVVGTVLIDGDDNHMYIDQAPGSSGQTDNRVVSATILGNNNGLPTNTNGFNKRAGTYIKQRGAGNWVENSNIEGDDNTGPAGNSNTFRNVHRIEQTGLNNGQLSSTASTLGSDGNRIWVFQNGTSNNFSVLQGLDASSTGNSATLYQDGSDNMATATQFGDNNFLEVDQDQDGNTATANVTGNDNGGGTLAGAAGTLASNNGLVSGLIKQDGLDNQATLTVTNSNGNQFAFLQQGNTNVIVGTVDGAGSNSATMVQIGNMNTSNFAQSGGGNMVSVSQ